MKHLIPLSLILATAYPSQAAPRSCRIATTGRVRQIVATSRAANHNAAHSKLVITAFAVPVAVPVAPFAPYWYGVAEYIPSSFPRSAWERTAVEATPRETSIINRHCASCHGAVSPKQGLSLVDVPSLSAEDRLRAIRAVVTGAMPPDTEPKLSDADRDSIIRELLGETDENSNDQ